MAPSPRRSRRSSTLAALALSAGLAACDDPTCVFSPDGCFNPGETPGALGAFATLPPAGAVLRSGRPEVDAVAPSGANVAPTTPLIVFFSESMAGSTLQDAFALTRITEFGPLPVPFSSVQLGEGQVWALVPVQALSPGDLVELRYAPGDEPARDLAGEPLDVAEQAVVLSFTVAVQASTTPELIAAWPLDNSTLRPQAGEILAFFDRAMDASTFNAASFRVQVAGGPPPFAALPTPVTIGSGLFSIPDRRLWRWQSVDGAGQPAPLGANVQVNVDLSPTGNKLESEAGNELAAESFDFRTGFLTAPSAVELLSSPADAIGLVNLTMGDPEELRLRLTLGSGQAGDRLAIYLFGTELGQDPDFVAVRRQVNLSGPDPLTQFEVDLTAVGLLADMGRPEPVLADGDLFFGFALERGSEVTPVRLLDLSGAASGIQTPVLDTTVPVLESLAGQVLSELPTGAPLVFRTDLRRTALWGKASERLRAIEIDSTLVSSAELAPVQGSDTNGRFLSCPLELGILTPAEQGLEVSFRLYDRAFNASPELYVAELRQLGGMGPELLAPGTKGQTIEIEVFDRDTLLPIAGARAIAHAEEADQSTYTLLGSAPTDAQGRAQLTSHAAPQINTLITIVAPSYDLITIHGPAVARLSIPLGRSLPQAAVVAGSLGATSSFAQLFLPQSDRAVHDGRQFALAPRLAATDSCTSLPGVGPACPFGPLPVRVQRPGAAIAFVGEFNLPLQSFSAGLFLTGYAAQIGTAALAPQGAQTLDLRIERLLSEPGVPVEELPISAPNSALSGLFTLGLDFGALIDDALISGAPDVVLDLEVAGLPGPFLVGLGQAFPVGPSDWLLRGAYPGGLAALIAAQGSPAAVLHYGVELRQTGGALSGTRLTFDQIEDFGGIVYAASVPAPLSPAQGALLPLSGFQVQCENVLVDGAFALADPGTVLGSGLYKARLVDATGRSWELYRSDLADGVLPGIPIAAPALPPEAGTGLAAGAAALLFETSAWQTYRPSGFLWSEFSGRRQFYGLSSPRPVLLQ
jgi:hypothetical protein